MPFYEYECDVCKKIFTEARPMRDCEKDTKCSCGGKAVRLLSIPALTGTRDSFGINKAFVDKRTGKTVDNFNTWEKLGYQDPLKSPMLGHDMKERIKEKQEKLGMR